MCKNCTCYTKGYGRIVWGKTPEIIKHINNIYTYAELDKNSTISILETVQKEGIKSILRDTAFYNLDMIIAVGYRVNSKSTL